MENVEHRDIAILLAHDDPVVREAAERINESMQRRRKVLLFVQEALSQLKLDMMYLFFDLECTKQERDEARKKNA